MILCQPNRAECMPSSSPNRCLSQHIGWLVGDTYHSLPSFIGMHVEFQSKWHASYIYVYVLHM